MLFFPPEPCIYKESRRFHHRFCWLGAKDPRISSSINFSLTAQMFVYKVERICLGFIGAVTIEGNCLNGLFRFRLSIHQVRILINSLKTM